MRYRTQLDQADARNALADALAAVLPDDAAWRQATFKAAGVWVRWRTTAYINANGTPKIKGRQEKHGDHEAWEVVQAILRDWPGHPLGAGTGAVNLWMMEHDPLTKAAR